MRTAAVHEDLVPVLADQLANVPLFRPLAPERRAEVVRLAALVDLEAGETVVREGERAEEFFVVLSGEAAVSIRVGDPGQPGETLETGTVGPLETLGEIGLLLREPRTATVVAQRPMRVLRFQAAAFHAAAERVPGFGLALARELARRLRAALEERNELAGEHAPSAQRVRRPDITDAPAYMARYYTTAIRSVLRKHQLLIDGTFPRYEDTLVVSEAERRKWFALFGVEGLESRTPFTYHTTSATMALMQIVGEVGVNFRHLMHLRSEVAFNAAGRPLEPGVAHRASYELVDIVRLRNDRVALVAMTRLHAPDGALISAQKDYFIIMNLAPEYLAALKRSKRLGKHDVEPLTSLSKRAPRLTPSTATVREIAIPDDMGLAYGRVSGDLNMVHTTRVAAAIFGHERPFVQGLCTLNYVMKHLTGATYAPPRAVEISFARRVFVGQTVRLLFNVEEFEVQDAEGKLLAFGAWEPGVVTAGDRAVVAPPATLPGVPRPSLQGPALRGPSLPRVSAPRITGVAPEEIR